MTTPAQRYFYFVFAAMYSVGMHYFQRHLGGYGLALPVNLMVWCFISVLISLALWHCSKINTVVSSPLLIAISLFVLSLFLPIIYGKNELLIHASERLIGISAGLLFLFSLYQIRLSINSTHRLIIWVLIGVIIEGLLGFIQQYCLSGNSWLDHDPYTMRPFGIFRQPNVASTFFVMGIALAAYLLGFSKNITKYNQAIIFIASFISAWLIILNTSKTATISLFLVLLCSAPLLYIKARKILLQRWYLSILLGLSIPFLINLCSDDFIAREIVDPFRPTIYIVSIFSISENLFTGTGYGSFFVNFQEAQAVYNDTVSPIFEFTKDMTHPHNEILLWGVEGGILPIITMLLMSIYILYRYFSLDWKAGLFFISIVFPPVFHSMTEYPFYHSAIVWITFIFTLYVVDTSVYIPKAHNLPQYLNFKITALLIPVITIPFMLSGMNTVNKLVNFVGGNFTQLEYLDNIINPVPIETRLEFDLFLHPLLSLDDNPEALHFFIQETENMIKYYPRDNLYHALYRAYQKTGDLELAGKRFQEGKRLFPGSQFFKE